MSILIKGMDMPTAQQGCMTIRIYRDGECVSHPQGTVIKGVKAVEVTTPHGRLVDVDNLIELCEIMADKCGETGESVWGQYQTFAEDLPTIIEAEE